MDSPLPRSIATVATGMPTAEPTAVTNTTSLSARPRSGVGFHFDSSSTPATPMLEHADSTSLPSLGFDAINDLSSLPSQGLETPQDRARHLGSYSFSSPSLVPSWSSTMGSPNDTSSSSDSNGGRSKLTTFFSRRTRSGNFLSSLALTPSSPKCSPTLAPSSPLSTGGSASTPSTSTVVQIRPRSTSTGGRFNQMLRDKLPTREGIVLVAEDRRRPAATGSPGVIATRESNEPGSSDTLSMATRGGPNRRPRLSILTSSSSSRSNPAVPVVSSLLPPAEFSHTRPLHTDSQFELSTEVTLSVPAGPSSLAALSPFPKSPVPRLPRTTSASNLSLLSLTRPSSPTVISASHFERMLPREMKLLCLAALVDLWEDEEREALRTGSDTADERWSGLVGARRELIKFSRVSRGWQSLVFDGTLWVTFSIRPFNHLSLALPTRSTASFKTSYLVPLSIASMPTQTILTIAARASTFLRTLDLRGFASISSATLHAIALSASTSNLTQASYEPSHAGRPNFIPRPVFSPRALPALSEDSTLLTRLDLQGCRSFSSNALHHLLANSPFLQTCNLKGLGSVSNSTLSILASCCPDLSSLNVSRCTNITAAGVGQLAKHPTASPMRHLYLANLASVDTSFFTLLAESMPHLVTLDLSHCRSLRDEHLLSFVVQPASPSLKDPPSTPSQHFIVQTSKQMGLDPSSSQLYYKRQTRLQHLNLSSSMRLTGRSLRILAGSSPELRYLELAGWLSGERLREGMGVGGEGLGDGLGQGGGGAGGQGGGGTRGDEALVDLLHSCPLLERVDFEDATGITDRVLDALGVDREEVVPGNSQAESPGSGSLSSSSRLEVLNVAFAGRLTEDGFLRLLKHCPMLRVLEADNTLLPDSVLSEFLRLSSNRLRLPSVVNDPNTDTNPIPALVPHAYKTTGALPLMQLSVLDSRIISKHLLTNAYADPVSPSRPRPGSRGWAFTPFEYQQHQQQQTLQENDQSVRSPPQRGEMGVSVTGASTHLSNIISPYSSSSAHRHHHHHQHRHHHSSQPPSDSPSTTVMTTGRNELDPKAPVLLSFQGWLLVDRVKMEVGKEAMRLAMVERNRRRRQRGEGSSGWQDEDDEEDEEEWGSNGRTRGGGGGGEGHRGGGGQGHGGGTRRLETMVVLNGTARGSVIGGAGGGGVRRFVGWRSGGGGGMVVLMGGALGTGDGGVSREAGPVLDVGGNGGGGGAAGEEGGGGGTGDGPEMTGRSNSCMIM